MILRTVGFLPHHDTSSQHRCWVFISRKLFLVAIGCDDFTNVKNETKNSVMKCSLNYAPFPISLQSFFCISRFNTFSTLICLRLFLVRGQDVHCVATWKWALNVHTRAHTIASNFYKIHCISVPTLPRFPRKIINVHTLKHKPRWLFYQFLNKQNLNGLSGVMTTRDECDKQKEIKHESM